MLRDARKYEGFTLQPAHLIHDFRGQETYDDAEFVRRVWPDCIVEEVDVPAYQREQGVSSFEQAARDLRYDFLARVAGRVGARLVALGHTADDLAETVLLHVARGSGLDGLRGMSEFDDWPYPAGSPTAEPPGISTMPGSTDALKVWRPLLGLRRSHTIAYCRAHRVDFRDDSTNYMREFARNRLRLDLMPAIAEQLNPRIVEALGRLARTASAQQEYLEQQVDARWPEVAPNSPTPGGHLRLNLAVITAEHRALQALLLRRAWSVVTGDAKRLTERHIAIMLNVVGGGQSGKTAQLPGGYTLVTDYGWAVLSPPTKSDATPYPELSREFRLTLPWGLIAVAVTKQDGWEVTCRARSLDGDAPLDTGDTMAAYLSPAALAEGATIRCWRPGDRIQPLGMSGSRKLQDVFTDAKVPRAWRSRIPLVVTPRGVAWAVGVRVADWAAVHRESGADATPATLVRFNLEESAND
jgi:tRNA(Ile)-lysidine synthetase-like protein